MFWRSDSDIVDGQISAGTQEKSDTDDSLYFSSGTSVGLS